MSDSPESPPPLDLSDLRLMPKWVSEFGKSSPSPAADYPEEDTRSRDRRDGRGPRDQQRRSFGGGSGGGGGTGGPPRGDRRPFDKPRGPGDQNRGPRPPGAGDRRDDRRGGGGGAGGGGGYRQDRGPRPQGRGGRDDRDRRGGGGGYGDRPRFEQAPPPVTGLNVQVEPEAKATEAMAAMIRTAGKAYSVFDAARLVLASGDRFHVRFKMAPEVNTKLYAVPTDGSLWLSREEALTHVIHGEAISSFYKVDEIELEEPKGNFTSVAVCGMTGEILGPPSHHSYQTTLHKIHREQFSHLPFEDYKRRVRTESTPEAVAKWKESQKHGMQWTWLKGETAQGEEPKTFKTRSEMEAHFRAHHADTLVGEVSDASVAGNIPKRLLSPSLYNHLRRAVDEGRKHLLSTAQQLCSGFERHGLKLFKRRGGKLWVSRTRPRLLEGNVVLSARIAKMVEIIKTQPGIQVKKLIESVAPSTDAPVTAKAAAPTPAVAAPLATDEAPVVSEPAVVAEAFGASAGTELPPIEPAPESAPAAAAEISTEAEVAETAPVETAEDAPVEKAPAAQIAPEPAPAPAPAVVIPAPAAAAAQHEWTGDQLHALQDLHWLNSEGYVIEYADGVVFPGVTEPPPPKPKVAPAAKAAAGESAAAPAEAEAEVPAEGEAEASAEEAEEIATESEPHGEAESELLEVAAETEAPVEIESTATEPAPEAASDEASSSDTEAEAEAEAQPAAVEEEK
ncbi:hypothetical protein [Roseimicrobium sp. ORNL1]|uniref:hypothetical protein n=1 Tax=Roseimicrobium sp. ORNL1 TaxID=2711231 RepID=UPI0013E1F544|nr:hypothetical protein [Roseimicrobium sp. ORNL1]QIF04526.1 hypothetical protein G5S37_24350 [Roseimicrobium sp. ORNL1]